MQSANTVRLKACSFSWQLVFSCHSFDHHIVYFGWLGCFGKIIGVGCFFGRYWGCYKERKYNGYLLYISFNIPCDSNTQKMQAYSTGATASLKFLLRFFFSLIIKLTILLHRTRKQKISNNACKSSMKILSTSGQN